MSYEYKVVPAPTRGLKAKGVKSAEDRFANALETVMNELAADGWDYLRTDTLPSEQREGLMGKTTVFQNMLVFRRTKAPVVQKAPAQRVTAPQPQAPTPPVAAPAAVTQPPAAPRPAPTPERPPSDVAAE